MRPRIANAAWPYGRLEFFGRISLFIAVDKSFYCIGLCEFLKKSTYFLYFSLDFIGRITDNKYS